MNSRVHSHIYKITKFITVVQCHNAPDPLVFTFESFEELIQFYSNPQLNIDIYQIDIQAMVYTLFGRLLVVQTASKEFFEQMLVVPSMQEYTLVCIEENIKQELYKVTFSNN